MARDSQGATTMIEDRKTRGGGWAPRGWLTMLAGAALALLGTAIVPEGAHALTACGTTISACCKIASSGSYNLSSGFTATGSSGACIRIVAPDVTLDGGSNTITGPGSGSAMKGVVIASGADNATVEGLTVKGFDTGVEVDANRASVLNVLAVEGGTGIVINGKRAYVTESAGETNAKNGMVINGSGFVGVTFGGIGNGTNGVVFNPSAVGTVSYEATSYSNAKTGVKIKDLTGGWFQYTLAYGNGTYGAWLRGSRNISFSDFNTYSNGLAGVYLGCHADFPSSAACDPGLPPTNANVLLSTGSSSFAAVDGGSSPVQPYGLVIDQGNHLNSVIVVTGSGNSVDDGYDGNSNCDNNSWIENTFAQTNQTCVQ